MAKNTGKEKLYLGAANFKPFEGDAPKAPATLEEALKVVSQLTETVGKLEKSNKDLLHETMDRKEKLRAYEKKEQDAQEALLKEQGKFKELSETLQPKAARLEKIEPILNELFDLEIADVPEDKRDLIPAGSKEEQLKWIKQAKAKKLFGEPAAPKKPPVASDPTKPGGDPTTPEFVSWDANDPRMLTLKPDQYQVWKQHNRAPKTGIKGWGGQS